MLQWSVIHNYYIQYSRTYSVCSRVICFKNKIFIGPHWLQDIEVRVAHRRDGEHGRDGPLRDRGVRLHCSDQQHPPHSSRLRHCCVSDKQL
jgi:hypothetical protein